MTVQDATQIESQSANGDFLLSVVVPMYNEEEGAKECVKRLKTVLDGMKCRYEILFVNDGSRDRTLEIMFGKETTCHLVQLLKRLDGGVFHAPTYLWSQQAANLM